MAPRKMEMLGKNLLFYMVASALIGLVAQVAGANIFIVVLAALLGPPILLLLVAIARYRGLL